MTFFLKNCFACAAAGLQMTKSAVRWRKGGSMGILLGMLSLPGQAFAEEHTACRDGSYPYGTHTAEALRAIAFSCKEKPMTALFLNRAYHADLDREARTLSTLSRGKRYMGQLEVDSYRLFIPLVELFAQQWYPDRLERTEFLNRIYRHRSEVAELRLRGYPRLADRLESSAARH